MYTVFPKVESEWVRVLPRSVYHNRSKTPAPFPHVFVDVSPHVPITRSPLDPSFVSTHTEGLEDKSVVSVVWLFRRGEGLPEGLIRLTYCHRRGEDRESLVEIRIKSKSSEDVLF